MASPDGMTHNSALVSLARCEQQFAYEYVEGLQRPPTAVGYPLLLGSWFHALMQVRNIRHGLEAGTLVREYDEDTLIDLGFDSLEPVPFGQVDTPWDAHLYITDNVHEHIPEGISDDLDRLPGFAWGLYTRYLAANLERTVNEEVLAVEQEWQREGPGGVVYGGKADAVVRRPDGLLVMTDYKTTSRKPGVQQRLGASQLHLYLWGMAPWAQKHFGQTFDLAEYSYAFTNSPGQLAVIKSGKRLYARSTGGDPYHIQAGIEGAIAEWNEKYSEEQGFTLTRDYEPLAEDIEKVLAKAEDNVDKFFQNRAQPVNITAVKNLLMQNKEALKQMEELQDGRMPIRALGSDNCRGCSFREICLAEMFGQDSSLLRADFTTNTIIPDNEQDDA